MHTDRYGNTRGEKFHNKESRKKKNFFITIQRMWNLKCKIIPVITGTTGIVTNGLKKIWKPYQENIQYVHCTRQLYLEHHTEY